MIPKEWRMMVATLLANKNIHDVTRDDVVAAWRIVLLIENVAGDEINKWMQGDTDAVT